MLGWVMSGRSEWRVEGQGEGGGWKLVSWYMQCSEWVVSLG